MNSGNDLLFFFSKKKQRIYFKFITKYANNFYFINGWYMPKSKVKKGGLIVKARSARAPKIAQLAGPINSIIDSLIKYYSF